VAVVDESAGTQGAGGVAFKGAPRRLVGDAGIGVPFRPIIGLTTTRISGRKSLARIDAVLGQVDPAAFLPSPAEWRHRPILGGL
jgi:hypothetical protein